MGLQEGKVRPVDPDTTVALRDALSGLIEANLTELVDAAYEKIEGRLRRSVMDAARRVIPENITAAIDTVVSARTSSIDERITQLAVLLSRLETKVAGAKALRFGPLPKPRKKPSKKRRRK